ncbi:MAG: hypothetical protein ACRC1K_16305, partial [Planctomycetia bacterium]
MTTGADSFPWARRVAGLLAVVALAGAVLLAVRGSGRAIVGNQSAASLAALLAAVGVAVGATVAAVASDRWWRSRRDGWDRWRDVDGRAVGSTGHFLMLTIAAALTQTVLLVAFTSANQVPRDDQADYLRVAAEVRAAGGAAALPAELTAGRHQEANRHPLYVALLTAGGEGSADGGFAVGKLLSAVFAALTLVVLAEAGRRRLGPLVG